MFPSSAILEEMFPSDRDGDTVRRRYAIGAIQAVITAGGLVLSDSEDDAPRSSALWVWNHRFFPDISKCLVDHCLMSVRIIVWCLSASLFDVMSTSLFGACKHRVSSRSLVNVWSSFFLVSVNIIVRCSVNVEFLPSHQSVSGWRCTLWRVALRVVISEVSDYQVEALMVFRPVFRSSDRSGFRTR